MEIGAFFGRVHGANLCDMTALNFNSLENLRVLGLRLKDETTKEDVLFYAEAATTAFAEAVQLIRNPPPKEEKPAKKDKKEKTAEAN